MPSPGNKPRPWALLLWPFLWVYYTIVEAIHKNRFQEPPAPPKVLVRFWDKDFNLLGSFEDVPKTITVDHPITGERYSWKVRFISE